MKYRGFDVRMTRDCIWLAVLPTDPTWFDGFQARNNTELRAMVDAYRDNEIRNPWERQKAHAA
jgi:hypothetical protein